MNFLVTRGVASARLSSFRYGAERPECHEKSEPCGATNRRAHFLVRSE
jgi:outer membrane protein OmpA-like peptidoglycan-associated protein